MTMSDRRAGLIVERLLELAVAVRDEGPDAVTEAAQRALSGANGDPVAALATAAALIRVDQPVDTWWQSPAPAPVPAPVPRHTEPKTDPDADCNDPGHATLRLHEARRERTCATCRAWEADYRWQLRHRDKVAS